MKVMGTDGVEESTVTKETAVQEQSAPEAGAVTAAAGSEGNEETKKPDNPVAGLALGKPTEMNINGTILKISPEEKVAFIDALVSNARFTLPYELFGGKVRIVVRSMTFEETRALSEWCVREAPKDISGQISGKFRRYMLCAQVEMFNGVKFEALQAPLFRTLDADGKTIKDPGWISQADYWDAKPSAVISAISKCVADFNAKYDFLVSKAEDTNFWSPDTH